MASFASCGGFSKENARGATRRHAKGTPQRIGSLLRSGDPIEGSANPPSWRFSLGITRRTPTGDCLIQETPIKLSSENKHPAMGIHPDVPQGTNLEGFRSVCPYADHQDTRNAYFLKTLSKKTFPRACFRGRPHANLALANGPIEDIWPTLLGPGHQTYIYSYTWRGQSGAFAVWNVGLDPSCFLQNPWFQNMKPIMLVPFRRAGGDCWYHGVCRKIISFII